MFLFSQLSSNMYYKDVVDRKKGIVVVVVEVNQEA